MGQDMGQDMGRVMGQVMDQVMSQAMSQAMSQVMSQATSQVMGQAMSLSRIRSEIWEGVLRDTACASDPLEVSLVFLVCCLFLLHGSLAALFVSFAFSQDLICVALSSLLLASLIWHQNVFFCSPT